MTESIRMFPLTQREIARRLEEIQTKKAESTKNLKDLDSTRDGDANDDPLMYQYLEQQQLVDRNERVMRTYISGDAEIITLDDVKNQETIRPGHQVRIRSTYEETGDIDEFTVTIGTTIDAQYLRGLTGTPFNDSDNILISDETPLGKALLGAEANSTIKYKTDHGSVKVRVIEFEPSSLLYNDISTNLPYVRGSSTESVE